MDTRKFYICSTGCARANEKLWSQEIAFSVPETGLHCSFDAETLGTLMVEADTSAVCSDSVNSPRGIQPA